MFWGVTSHPVGCRVLSSSSSPATCWSSPGFSAPCAWPPGLASPRTAVLTVAPCVLFLWKGFLSFSTNQELCHFLFLAPWPPRKRKNVTHSNHSLPFCPKYQTLWCVPTTCWSPLVQCLSMSPEAGSASSCWSFPGLSLDLLLVLFPHLWPL